MQEAWVMQQFSYEPIPFEDFVKECVVAQGVSSAQVKGIVEAMSNRYFYHFFGGRHRYPQTYL